MSILVAGIGNIFQGDDAFGCEVAQALCRRSLPDEVRVVDFGIRGLDLAYALMDRPDLTILLDTVSRGGAAGSVYTIEPDIESLEALEQASIETHALDPARVLQTVKAMGGELGRILLVGCEPAELGGEEGCMGLTAPVQAAVRQAVDVVEDLIRKELVAETQTCSRI